MAAHFQARNMNSACTHVWPNMLCICQEQQHPASTSATPPGIAPPVPCGITFNTHHLMCCWLQARVFSLKTDLEARIRRADDITSAFAHFKHEICLIAEHSKTGKTVNNKVLAALEERGA